MATADVSGSKVNFVATNLENEVGRTMSLFYFCFELTYCANIYNYFRPTHLFWDLWRYMWLVFTYKWNLQ